MKRNLVGKILGKIKIFVQDFVPIRTALRRGMVTLEDNLADDTTRGFQDKDHLMASSSGKDNFEVNNHHTGWNKSCVSCSTRKQKCDGLHPCRCVQLVLK